MKIVKNRDDEGGAELKPSTIQEDGRLFVYFLPAGTDKANPNEPHFIIKPAIAYGDVGTVAFDLNAGGEQFVCPDVADLAELKQLRDECAELRRGVIDPKDLEKLRADSAELTRLRENRAEASRLRARLAEIEGHDDGD